MSYWVVDANIAIKTVAGLSQDLEKFWDRVDREQITPCAPRLWVSEITSGIRLMVFQKDITSEDAEQVLRTVHGLRFEIIDEDDELSLRALELAGRLGQSKAYDAFYLTLAEKLVVDFWTMDERLVNRCRKDLKLSWVHSISEI